MALSKKAKQRIRDNKEKRNAWPYDIKGETSAWERELKKFLNDEWDKVRALSKLKPHDNFPKKFEEIAGLYTTVVRKQWYSVRHDRSTALFKLLNPSVVPVGGFKKDQVIIISGSAKDSMVFS